MNVFDGKESFEITREKETFLVFLESTQIKKESSDFISEEVFLHTEAPSGFQAALEYRVSENAVSLSVARSEAKSHLEKLKLAQKLSGLLEGADSYKIPFLHIENIMVAGEKLFMVHFGLANLVAPFSRDNEHLLNNYKALILAIFNEKASYDKLVTGLMALDDKFSQQIVSFQDAESLAEFIDQALASEIEQTNRSSVLVSKKQYHLYRILGIAALVVALVAGYFVFSLRSESQMQESIIASQDYYLSSNYADAFSALDDYEPSQLPKTARYVLASSSINLADLTNSQKESILNNISAKSDDNTLDYWVYMGRGDFDQSLDLAQNLGDDQLTLLAYTDLYETTKLDNDMDGAKKQKLLAEYTKKIKELSKNLEK